MMNVSDGFTMYHLHEGFRYRHNTTEGMKERLRWMFEHPGAWLHWSVQMYPPSSRHIHEPSFERRVVSHTSVHDGYGPYKDWAPGLWVRYVGEK